MACDPTVDFNRIIQNNSDHELVYFYDQMPDEDSVYIPSKSEVIVYTDHKLGTVSSFENCDQGVLDIERLIVADSSRQLKFNLQDFERWEFVVIEKDAAGGGECECRLVVENEDIE